jgi:hypothetical protein
LNADERFHRLIYGSPSSRWLRFYT